MVYVPVLSCSGKPLMPCHPARARELVRQGRAVRRFNRGLFYIQLLERKEGNIQPIAVGIDPGGKKEGFSVKSEAHTYLNIQADALIWVKETIEVRRTMRRARRFRKTPCRKNRYNRAKSPFPPSTKARWQWKLRLRRWLSKLFPIACFIVEDIKARTLRGKRWNTSFSPLQVGKQWLYDKLSKIAQVETKQGFETKELRDTLGLKKTGHKRAEVFEAHCIDSWVLANGWTGGAYSRITNNCSVSPRRAFIAVNRADCNFPAAVSASPAAALSVTALSVAVLLNAPNGAWLM